MIMRLLHDGGVAENKVLFKRPLVDSNSHWDVVHNDVKGTTDIFLPSKGGFCSFLDRYKG